MTTDQNQRSRGVQSVVVSMTVLRAVAEADGPTSLSDIASKSGMPAAKAHRYLVSLIESEMVVQRGSGTYDLGPSAASIGIAAVARLDVVNRTADALPTLVDRSGYTAMLSVLGASGPTVVRWERTYPPLITSLGIGSILPFLQTATGRAFLAWLPDRITASFVLAEDSTIKPSDISDICNQVRLEGIAVANEIYIPGLFAIAAPVLNLQSQAEAVVTLISTNASLTDPDGEAKKLLKSFLGL